LYTKFLEKKIETPPGPIDNKALSKKYPQDKTNTYKLNDKVWRFMTLMYGGGPPIWEGAPPNLIEVPSSSSRSPINLNNSLLNDSTMKLSDAKTADTMNRSTMADGMKSSYNEALMSRSTPLAGRSKPSGLHNELNYCYLNAAAQGLVGLEQLCSYTAKEKYREHVTNKVPKFWKAFHELVSLCNSKASKLTPKLLRKLATNRFSAEEQHDSHEFIRYLLSGMQDEMNIPKPKRPVEFKDANTAWEYYRKYNNSIIDELFAGQYISRVSCKSCGFISVAFDPFLDISLPIIPMKTKSIDDCLAMFTKEEEIKDSYTCEKCKSKGKVSRRLSISRYPKILVIHLKRFQTYPKKKKLSDHITFPVDNLKIKRYTLNFYLKFKDSGS
jgi:ubiquitin C-terminal hydrolase